MPYLSFVSAAPGACLHHLVPVHVPAAGGEAFLARLLPGRDLHLDRVPAVTKMIEMKMIGGNTVSLFRLTFQTQ